MKIRLKRGTTAKNDIYLGDEGEATFDTEEKYIRVHDGTTIGGIPIAKREVLDVAIASATSIINLQAKTINTDNAVGINQEALMEIILSQSIALISLQNKVIQLEERVQQLEE